MSWFGDRALDAAPTSVTLHLSSESDGRWNCAWRGTSASPFNPAFEQKVAELTARYGPPPDDLEFGAIKD